jgi:hypothetical protein
MSAGGHPGSDNGKPAPAKDPNASVDRNRGIVGAVLGALIAWNLPTIGFTVLGISVPPVIVGAAVLGAVFYACSKWL